MTRILSFERELYQALDLVPLAVRRALDLAGIKLPLAGWQAMAFDDRRALAAARVTDDASLAAFTSLLREAAARAGASLSPLPRGPEMGWRAPATEEAVKARLAEIGLALPEGAWARLDDEARYLLAHLAKKGDPDRLRAAASELL
jgi:hypothetical protein